MQNLKQLKRQSLYLKDGLAVRWPKQTKPGTLKVSKITEEHVGSKVYATNNDVIAFISNDGFFVTPACRTAFETLKKAGYEQVSNLFVPFSHGDLPVQPGLRKRWYRLISEAERA